MEARFQTRAWETQTGTIEVAIIDNRDGRPKSRFVQPDEFEAPTSVEGLQPGYYLRIDPDSRDALLGGAGVSLYYITEVTEGFVHYMSFRGWSHDEMWAETADNHTTFNYILRKGNLKPVEKVGHPTQTVLPTTETDREVTA